VSGLAHPGCFGPADSVPAEDRRGLTLKEFEAKRTAGTLRQRGPAGIVDFIAARLGWKLDKTTESLEPVMAEQAVTTGYKPIAQGMARGVSRSAGFHRPNEVITLTFRAASATGILRAGQIEGDPSFTSRIAGGINGDIATCAVTLNVVRSILEVAPASNHDRPAHPSCRLRNRTLARVARLPGFLFRNHE